MVLIGSEALPAFLADKFTESLSFIVGRPGAIESVPVVEGKPSSQWAL